jgi:hypothetical protein
MLGEHVPRSKGLVMQASRNTSFALVKSEPSGTVLLICATNQNPPIKRELSTPLSFVGGSPGAIECLAFRLPFADKLLKQFVFFDRSGHFLAGGRI